VETTEEPIGGLSLLAYRRVSTTLDLDAALKRDAAKGALPERRGPF
jgi:hypothetical protein